MCWKTSTQQSCMLDIVSDFNMDFEDAWCMMAIVHVARFQDEHGIQAF